MIPIKQLDICNKGLKKQFKSYLTKFKLSSLVMINKSTSKFVIRSWSLIKLNSLKLPFKIKELKPLKTNFQESTVKNFLNTKASIFT